jgi:endonuclease YncB( thermonuclease family)
MARSIHPLARFGLAAALCCTTAAPGLTSRAYPRDDVSGPVAASVLRVIDGDTFVADAHVWPGETVRVSVRIRGIDAPELHSRCAAERVAATQARAALAGLLGSGPVTISNIGGDKYYGRVLADVATGEGDVAPRMLSRALAKPYAGGRRMPYCG